MRSFVVVVTVAVLMAGLPAQASAFREHVVERDVPWGGEMACGSEPVAFEGMSHLVLSASINEQTGAIKVFAATSSRGTGIGLTTKGLYDVTGKDHTTEHLTLGSASTLHFVVDMRAKGVTDQTKTSHFYLRLMVTFPASGGPPSAETERVGCKVVS